MVERVYRHFLMKWITMHLVSHSRRASNACLQVQDAPADVESRGEATDPAVEDDQQVLWVWVLIAWSVEASSAVAARGAFPSHGRRMSRRPGRH